MSLDPQAYARVYGPTVGDRVRLGDTSLVIEVEAVDAGVCLRVEAHVDAPR